MTVLIAGGAGYIGSHMVLDLVARGETPVVLDDLSTGFDFLLPDHVPLIRGDIADQSLVHKIIVDHGIDTIAHFAAKIVVPDSVSDPLGYYESNTAKARNLIDAAVKSGLTKFISHRRQPSMASLMRCQSVKRHGPIRCRLMADRN